MPRENGEVFCRWCRTDFLFKEKSEYLPFVVLGEKKQALITSVCYGHARRVGSVSVCWAYDGSAVVRR